MDKGCPLTQVQMTRRTSMEGRPHAAPDGGLCGVSESKGICLLSINRFPDASKGSSHFGRHRQEGLMPWSDRTACEIIINKIKPSSSSC